MSEDEVEMKESKRLRGKKRAVTKLVEEKCGWKDEDRNETVTMRELGDACNVENED